MVTFKNLGVNITARSYVRAHRHISLFQNRCSLSDFTTFPNPPPSLNTWPPAPPPQASFFVVATASVILRYDNAALPAATDLLPGAFPQFAATSGALAVATGFTFLIEAPRAGAPFAARGDFNATYPGSGRATGRLPLVAFNYTRTTRAMTAVCAAEAAWVTGRARAAEESRAALMVRRSESLLRMEEEAAAAGVGQSSDGEGADESGSESSGFGKRMREFFRRKRGFGGSGSARKARAGPAGEKEAGAAASQAGQSPPPVPPAEESPLRSSRR